VAIKRNTPSKAGHIEESYDIAWRSGGRSGTQSVGNGKQGERRRKEKRFRPRFPGIARILAQRRAARRSSIGQTFLGRTLGIGEESRGNA
jgi:hypothetical protein